MGRHRDTGLRPLGKSGSGSCVFAAMADEAQADAVVAGCPVQWRAYKVRGLVQSPLADAVSAYRAGRAG